eukprot:Protomagalhaensia_sp_Gyna_25__1046@NODE_1503_length_1781_cov_10_521814_g1218_i0_p1_GENE_NODE_1503_length_1781_cov_10_521814_g1218_i0NODE_1503_length_1781_cov_10_521814_g1218_i0_p1_ORF_typecomplete_len348_score38_09PseudoU_synth_2/PF00849_22/5_1e24_NODE_1503_length_1781_cov_10_521814_g1218_i0611104
MDGTTISAVLSRHLTLSCEATTADEIARKVLGCWADFAKDSKSEDLTAAFIDGLEARLQQLVASRRAASETEEADVRFLLVFPEYLINVITIAYEDDDCVIVNKPFDHRIDLGKEDSASSFPNEPCVQRWFKARYATLAFRMCHQLDYATSGLMTLAKSQRSCARINKQFVQRSIQKEYLAIVVGRWESASFYKGTNKGSFPFVQLELVDGMKLRVSFQIAPSGHNGKHMQVVAPETPGSQSCITDVEVVGYHELDHLQEKLPMTMLRLFPRTGRTHQLRVTTSALGHTILGDRKYGDGSEWEAVHRDMPRMYLHAEALTLELQKGRIHIRSTEPPLVVPIHTSCTS